MTSAASGYAKPWRDGIADVADVLHLFIALQETLQGQRGWLCRAVEGGIVRRGDAIELVSIAREALS
jgi:MOSC domain-containing protein YiiM